MDKKKVLVKVHPEGKFVVDIDKNIDVADITANCRVALRNDSYTLHKILPNKVDPLVSFSFTCLLYLYLFISFKKSNIVFKIPYTDFCLIFDLFENKSNESLFSF